MKALKITGLIIWIAVMLGSIVAGTVFYRDTITDWWRPILLSAATGAAMTPVMRRLIARTTPMSDKIYTGISAFILSASMVYGLAMSLNTVLADRKAGRNHEAEVIDKHIEQRTRYRRVGRGRMVPAGHYNVYSITVRLPDGRSKTYETSHSKYNRTRSGSHLPITVCPGFLGYDIIIDSKF